MSELPKSVDLRDQTPPVVDQGGLGSSTSCAVAAAIEHTRLHPRDADMRHISIVPITWEYFCRACRWTFITNTSVDLTTLRCPNCGYAADRE